MIFSIELGRKEMQVRFWQGTRVIDVKRLLEISTKIPRAFQKLIFEGKLLQDQENLTKCGIRDGSRLMFVGAPATFDFRAPNHNNEGRAARRTKPKIIGLKRKRATFTVRKERLTSAKKFRTEYEGRFIVSIIAETEGCTELAPAEGFIYNFMATCRKCGYWPDTISLNWELRTSVSARCARCNEHLGLRMDKAGRPHMINDSEAQRAVPLVYLKAQNLVPRFILLSGKWKFIVNTGDEENVVAFDLTDDQSMDVDSSPFVFSRTHEYWWPRETPEMSITNLRALIQETEDLPRFHYCL